MSSLSSLLLLSYIAALAPAARALFECGDSAAGPYSRTIAGRALDYRSGTNASFADFGLPMQLAFCPWYAGAGGGGASLLVVDAAAAVIRRVNLAPAPAAPGTGQLSRQGTVDIFMGAPTIRAPSTVFADYFPYTDRFLAFLNVSGIACSVIEDAIYVADAGLGTKANQGEVHALIGSQTALTPPNMVNIFNLQPEGDGEPDVEPECRGTVNGPYYTFNNYAYQGISVYAAPAVYDSNGTMLASAINLVAMADYACVRVVVRDMLTGTILTSQPSPGTLLRGSVAFFAQGTPGNFTDIQVAFADAGNSGIRAFGIGAGINPNTVRYLAGSGTGCSSYGSSAYLWSSPAAKGCGDGGPSGSATSALFSQPQGVVWNGVPLCNVPPPLRRAICGEPSSDPTQRALLYIADTTGHAIRVLDLANSSLTLLAGMPDSPAVKGYNGDGPAPARSMLLSYPTGIAYDASEPALYISDTNNFIIRKITGLGLGQQAMMVTIAGRPADGGQASEALGFVRGASSQVRLGAPSDVLVSEADGKLYISDAVMNVVYAMPLEPLDGRQPLTVAVGSAPLPNTWPLPPAFYGFNDFSKPAPMPGAAFLSRPSTLARSTVPGYDDGFFVMDSGSGNTNGNTNHPLRGFGAATSGALAFFVPRDPGPGWFCGGCRSSGQCDSCYFNWVSGGMRLCWWRADRSVPHSTLARIRLAYPPYLPPCFLDVVDQGIFC